MLHVFISCKLVETTNTDISNKLPVLLCKYVIMSVSKHNVIFMNYSAESYKTVEFK